MNRQRAKVEAFLNCRGAGRQPEQEAALLTAADAYDAALATGELTSERLQVLVEAVSSRHALVWSEASEMLGALSERWREAGDAILALSRSPKADVRFHALFCVKPAIPAEIADPILRAGLVDKSAKVRWKAAERIERHERRHLLPELAAALAAESNPEARRVMLVSLHLLRDGYLLEPWSEEQRSLTVRVRHCHTVRLVTTRELEDRGLEALVIDHRAEAERFTSHP